MKALTIGHGNDINSQRANNGMALVIVLWLLVLLSAIAMSFIANMRDEVKLTHNATGALQARYLAEAGIYRALAGMLDSDRRKRWPVDGAVQRFTEDGSEFAIAVLSEAAKIDINFASAEVLYGLLNVANVPPGTRDAIVGAILDWRDKDSLQNLNGAEDEDYARAGLVYGAKDASIASLQELRLVMGMTEAVFDNIKSQLTVHSGSGVVDVDLASTQVLAAAAGGDLEKAEQFVAQRRQQGINNAQVLSYTGQAFGIAAVARTGGGAVAGVRAVIKVDEKKPQPFELLQWEEAVTQCLLDAGNHWCYE